MIESIKVFFSYAHEDEALKDKLEKYLIALARTGMIQDWYGIDVDKVGEVDTRLNDANIILLLISPDFLVSDYCYSIEMKRLVERHESREIRLVPIILHSVDWKKVSFGEVQPLPTNGIPITAPEWHSVDEALIHVFESIKVTCKEMRAGSISSFIAKDEPFISHSLPSRFYQLYDVFVKSGIPDVTFVKRDDFTRLELSLAQPNRGVVIEGPSGAGKTTSLKRAIEGLTANQHSSEISLRVSTPLYMLSARSLDHQKKLLTLKDWHNDGTVIIDDFHRLDISLRQEITEYLEELASVETDSLKGRDMRKLVIIGIPQSGQMLIEIPFDAITRVEIFRWGKVKNELIYKMIEQGEKALNIEIDRRDDIVLAANGSFNVAQFLCFNICHKEGITMTQNQTRLIQPNINDAISEVIVDLSRKFGESIRRFIAMNGGYQNPICVELLRELAQASNGVLSLPTLRTRRRDLADGLRQFIQEKWMDKLCREYPQCSNYLFFDTISQELMIDDPQLSFYLRVQFSTSTKEVGPVAAAIHGEDTENSVTLARRHIFISYSHKDKKWLNKLQTILKPLERKGLIETWSDTQIKPGTNWQEEINKALSLAKAAILLVTPDFLASDFIANNELPPLLEAAKEEGLIIYWIAVSHSLYQVTDIATYQAVNDPSEPLDSLAPPKLNRELVLIAKKITESGSEV